MASKILAIFRTLTIHIRQILRAQKNCGGFSAAAVCRNFDFPVRENRFDESFRR
jgi:hypothetical protein